METTATVRAPALRAASATTGIAPVPVPPPIPAVRKTASTPSKSFWMAFLLSSAAILPSSGLLPAPWPLVSLSPMMSFSSAGQPARADLSVLMAQ